MLLGVSTAGAVLIGWAGFLGLLVAWLWLRGSRAPLEKKRSAATEAERRAGRDRRHLDIGPPAGTQERRRGFDRRAASA